MEGKWFPMPRKDLLVILFLVLYPTIFFLPWSYDIQFYNVSLLAWSAWAFYFLAPIVSILVILSEDKDAKVRLGKDQKKSV